MTFQTRNPDGLVMDKPAFNRNYGANPYVQYDSLHRPFLYSGELPPHDIPALARVVRVGDRAWPLTRLAEEGTVTEEGVTLTWAAGQASALDTDRIGTGKDVGNVRVRDAAGNDIAHDVMFAFAFHAFWPKGQWMTPTQLGLTCARSPVLCGHGSKTADRYVRRSCPDRLCAVAGV